MVAMAMSPRGWDEGGEALDEFEWGEAQDRLTIRAGFRESVEQPFPLGLPSQALTGKGGARAVAEQALEPGAVTGGHRDARINREPAMVPGAHVGDGFTAEQGAAPEQSQHPLPHDALDCEDVLFAQSTHGMEAQLCVFVLTKPKFLERFVGNVLN